MFKAPGYHVSEINMGGRWALDSKPEHLGSHSGPQCLHLWQEVTRAPEQIDVGLAPWICYWGIAWLTAPGFPYLENRDSTACLFGQLEVSRKTSTSARLAPSSATPPCSPPKPQTRSHHYCIDAGTMPSLSRPNLSIRSDSMDVTTRPLPSAS